MERWMKERAAKSFGGPCMSKFVQENERKRIMRLKNMKSSIVKMSCNKHDNWTRNKVEKRHRDLKKQSNLDIKNTVNVGDESKSASAGGNPDFDLCFRPTVDTTKSGLKLRLTDSDEVSSTSRNRKVAARRESAEEDKKNNNHHHFMRGANVGGKMPAKKKEWNENEGKENQSPSQVRPPNNNKSNSTKSNSTKSNSCYQTSGRLNIRKIKSTTTKGSTSSDIKSPITGSNKDKIQCTTRKNATNNNNTKQSRDRKSISGTVKTKTTKKSRRVLPNKSDSTTMNSNSRGKTKSQNLKLKSYREKKIGMKSSPSKKRNQLHVNRGVSLDALSKERLEALAIMEELDSGPSWGRKLTEDTTKKNVYNSFDSKNELEMKSLSLSTQNLKKKSNSLRVDDLKRPSPSLSSSDKKNLNAEKLLEYCDDDLSCESLSNNEENSLNREKHYGDHHNNNLDRSGSDASFTDTSLHNAHSEMKEIEGERCSVPLCGDFDDIDPIPKEPSPSISIEDEIEEDEIEEEGEGEGEEEEEEEEEEECASDQVHSDSASKFPCDQYSRCDDSRSKEEVFDGLHSDDLSQKTTSVNEMIHKETSDESKLSQHSNSDSSMYSESFESEVNPVEYNVDNNRDMNVFESSGSEILLDGNPDDDDGDDGDSIASSIERNQSVDWTPQFEAESFFVPMK